MVAFGIVTAILIVIFPWVFPLLGNQRENRAKNKKGEQYHAGRNRSETRNQICSLRVPHCLPVQPNLSEARGRDGHA